MSDIADCLPLPSNQCIYRQITSYGKGAGESDHEVYSLTVKGGHGQNKINSYNDMTLIGVRSTMHLLHLNYIIM